MIDLVVALDLRGYLHLVVHDPMEQDADVIHDPIHAEHLETVDHPNAFDCEDPAELDDLFEVE